MDMTFTLKDAGLFCIIVAVVIMIIYIIVLLKNLITTVKHTNVILADTQEITAVAKTRVKEVDGILDEVSTSVGGLAKAFKGNESLIQSLSSVSKAITSLIGLIKDKK